MTLFETRVQNGVAWLVADGDVDFASWKYGLSRLVTHPDFRPGMPIAVDVRCGAGMPPPGTAGAVAHSWRSLAAGSPIALVAAPGVAYGVARQISAHSGGRIEAFTAIAEALHYLRG